MFEVHGLTIRLSRGDTGLIMFETEGIKLTPQDRAVFTVKRRSGGVVLQKVIEPENNGVLVPIVHEDTQALRPDDYEWDIRYVLDPQMDENGMVTSGREVHTPYRPGVFAVERTVGSV